MKVAILFDAGSEEWSPQDVAAVVANVHEVRDVLRRRGHEVELLPIRLGDFRWLSRARRADLVFNLCEGINGHARFEDFVVATLELTGVPFTGCRTWPTSVCHRKHVANTLLSSAGLPVPAFVLAQANKTPAEFPLPAIVKPAFEGSGKGVTVKSLCRNRSQLVRQVSHLLATYAEPVVIETYLPGQEFTVAILGNGHEARCLPIIGMRFDMLPKGAPPIYGYEAKWIWDTPSKPLEIYDCPADIPESLAEEVRAAALAAYHALECRDWCRVDIRCDAAGHPMVVELNPLPGVLPDPRDHSCFPKAAAAAGMSYDDLIRTVADIAWRRISGRSLLAEVA